MFMFFSPHACFIHSDGHCNLGHFPSLKTGRWTIIKQNRQVPDKYCIRCKTYFMALPVKAGNPLQSAHLNEEKTGSTAAGNKIWDPTSNSFSVVQLSNRRKVRCLSFRFRVCCILSFKYRKYHFIIKLISRNYSAFDKRFSATNVPMNRILNVI